MGDAADPDALAQPTCRRCPSSSASTSASTATTSRRSSTTRRRSASVLGLPGYARVLQGQADHDDDLRLLGRAGARNRYDGTRFTLQEIFLSSLTNFLYDDGREPGGRAVVVGRCRRSGRSRPGPTASSCWRWSRTPTTATFYAPPPQGGGACSPNAGPGRDRRRSPTSSPSSRSRVREAAERGDAADRRAPRPRRGS